MANRAETGFDWKVLDALLQRGTSKEDCASIMDCSPETVLREIKKEKKMSFKEYRETKLAHTRIKLIEMVLDRARKSDTLLIFATKNMCGWDKKTEVELSVKDKKKVKEMSNEEVLAHLKALKLPKDAK